jgi:hypothetical protein
MRQLNDVELAINRLATGVTLHYAEQGDQRGGEALYLRALCGGKMSQDIRRGESSWRLEHTLQACKMSCGFRWSKRCSEGEPAGSL